MNLSSTDSLLVLEMVGLGALVGAGIPLLGLCIMPVPIRAAPTPPVAPAPPRLGPALGPGPRRHCVPAYWARPGVAGARRVGQGERRRFHGFKGEVDSCHFLVCPAQRAKHQKRIFGFGQDDPFAPTRFDE